MSRRIDTQAEIDWVRLTDQAGDPASPAAGYKYFYAKSGGLYLINSAGSVVGPLTPGAVATDTIWDAAGDLVQGTGANTASKLSIGTARQLLRVNSGATAAEWVSDGRVLISEQSPSATNIVTWSTIPSIFWQLRVEANVRSDRAATAWDAVHLVLNTDTTAANYRFTRFASSTLTGDDNNTIGIIPGNTSPANSSGQLRIEIFNYAGTTFKKQARAECNYREDDSSAQQLLIHYTLEWENTAAISTLSLSLEYGNYVAGSKCRLYGIF